MGEVIGMTRNLKRCCCGKCECTEFELALEKMGEDKGKVYVVCMGCRSVNGYCEQVKRESKSNEQE